MDKEVKTGLGLSILVVILATFSFFAWRMRTQPVPAPGQPAPLPGAVSPIGAMCTEEARICPDGSAVGRTGPNCEFEACPDFVGIADKLVVSAPIQDGEIVSPVAVSGRARGSWFFEGSFPVEVYDANDKKIGSAPVSFVSREPGDTWMTEEFVDFEGEITFTAPKTETGYLLFKKDNPSGDPDRDESFKLLVKFAKSIDISSWKIYKNDNYRIQFNYPATLFIKESEKNYSDNMGAFCQSISLNEKSFFDICDKTDELTQYGLREPDGMDPSLVADLKIGGQVAKKYSSGDFVSYVVMSPGSNRITLNTYDASAANVAILEKILSTFKFTK